MSQEKVNRYKEEKINRKAKLRRERIKGMIRKIVVLTLSLALVGWVVYSAVDTYQANRPRDMVTVNYESITDYFQTVQDEMEAEAAAAVEEAAAAAAAEAEEAAAAAEAAEAAAAEAAEGEDGEEPEDEEEE